jgi:SAM-dependent methyltransferase
VSATLPKLTDTDYTRDEHGIYIYDESPSVPSGLFGSCSISYIQKWMIQQGWQHLWRNICALRLLPSNSRVLDVACGYAEVGKLAYTQRMACAWIGMDLLHGKLKKAKALGWGKSPLMLLQRDMVKPFPFESGAIDAVLSLETIEHVEKEYGELFLSEVSRVLRPGGHLVLSTPNAQSEHKRDFDHHFHEYELGEIQEVILAAGLKDVDVYGIQLEGNIRHWDKELEDDPLYNHARKGMFPTMVKTIWSFDRPAESENLLIHARKPTGAPAPSKGLSRSPVKRGPADTSAHRPGSRDAP